MMQPHEALEVLAAFRGDQVVISSMGAVGIWPRLSDTPLDFAYLPSSMGQAVPLALGIALAQPDRGVIVLTGDGSLLMNCGCLATVATYPATLRIVLLENGLYEVTGGQATVGSGQIDFAGLARCMGIPTTYQFTELAEWRAGAPACLNGPGPGFIALKVQGEQGHATPKPPRAMVEQIARLRGALGVTGA